MKSKIYMNEVVHNEGRKLGAVRTYYPCVVELIGGVKVNALFTEAAINQAIERAEKNPEDFEAPILEKKEKPLSVRLFGFLRKT